MIGWVLIVLATPPADVSATLERIQEAYYQERFDDLDVLLGTAPREIRRRDAAQLSLWRAAARLATGDRVEAASAAAAALRLSPDIAVDLAVLPPSFEALLEQVRAELPTPSALRVQCEPAEATVTLDGYHIAGEVLVLPGRYVLSATADGYTPLEQEVRSPQEQRVVLVMEPMVAADEIHNSSEPREPGSPGVALGFALFGGPAFRTTTVSAAGRSPAPLGYEGIEIGAAASLEILGIFMAIDAAWFYYGGTTLEVVAPNREVLVLGGGQEIRGSGIVGYRARWGDMAIFWGGLGVSLVYAATDDVEVGGQPTGVLPALTQTSLDIRVGARLRPLESFSVAGWGAMRPAGGASESPAGSTGGDPSFLFGWTVALELEFDLGPVPTFFVAYQWDHRATQFSGPSRAPRDPPLADAVQRDTTHGLLLGWRAF